MGSQDHSNQLLKFVDTFLKETNIDICLSNSKEECPRYGCLVSETLRKENKTSSLALPKIQTAYEEFSISKLTFDIRKIDSLVDLITTKASFTNPKSSRSRKKEGEKIAKEWSFMVVVQLLVFQNSISNFTLAKCRS